MVVRIIEIVAKREGSRLTTISEKEIGIRKDEDFNWKPLCKLYIKKMVRDGVIPDPQREVVSGPPDPAA